MDLAIFRWANGLYDDAPAVWTFLETPEALAILVVVALGIAWARRNLRWVLPALLAVALSDVLAARVLKPAIGRARPCAELDGVDVPRVDGSPHCGSGLAMPSAHAANTMAVATVLAAPELAVLSMGVGFGRVITGQHWPSDVAAGWALGIGLGMAVRAAATRAFGWQ